MYSCGEFKHWKLQTENAKGKLTFKLQNNNIPSLFLENIFIFLSAYGDLSVHTWWAFTRWVSHKIPGAPTTD